MSKTVKISPLTRIEGHLAIHIEAEQAGESWHVAHAKCEGEMFRGFEQILRGRDPLDAQVITQRICGVCPISHGMASVQAQEMAYSAAGGYELPNQNGRLLQNLILAGNYIQSHLAHFYHLSALDFVDVTAVLQYKGKDRVLNGLKTWVKDSLDRNEAFPAAPFLPRYDADYVQSLDANMGLLNSYIKALRMRALAHETAAVFGAKLPHSTSLVPGGCTQAPNIERLLAYKVRLDRLRAFIIDTYIPDLLAVAKEFPHYWEQGKGYNNFLAFGVFREDQSGRKWFPSGVILDGKFEAFDQRQIRERVEHSRFSGGGALHPYEGKTDPAPDKSDAYSWLKAPRYKDKPVEVGPLARIMIGYQAGGWIREKVDAFLKNQAGGLSVEKLHSVLGRHVARGLEALWIAEKAYEWLDQVDTEKPPAADFEIPKKGQGYGLTEAPRGALGHWLVIDDYRIKNYQCVVPTTWNCSPRDGQGAPGPVEKSLEGTPLAKPDHPMEAARVVRSFDPCLACAVH